MMENWSSWIAHNGKDCPVVGMRVMTQCADGKIIEGVPTVTDANPVPFIYYSLWIWNTIPAERYHWRVVRYRIYRGAAFQLLVEQLDVPETEPAL